MSTNEQARERYTPEQLRTAFEDVAKGYGWPLEMGDVAYLSSETEKLWQGFRWGVHCAATLRQSADSGREAEREFFARDFYEEVREGKKAWPKQTDSGRVGDDVVAFFCRKATVVGHQVVFTFDSHIEAFNALCNVRDAIAEVRLNEPSGNSGQLGDPSAWIVRRTYSHPTEAVAALTFDEAVADDCRERGGDVTPLFTSPKNCGYCGAHCTQHHDSWCEATPEGAVGVIGADWTLRWIGTGPISPIIEKHGLKVGTKLYTHPAPAASPAGVPDGEVRLWDTQWVNIVNHDNCYRDWDKADAINHAVKMTEQAIARNVADGKLPPPRIAAAPSAPEGDGGVA